MGDYSVWSVWMLFGVILLAADILLINVYYLIWFGLSAIVVGAMLAIFPDIPASAQFIVFGALSAALLALWLKVLKPRNAGKELQTAQREMPGQPGVVVRYNSGRGVLRLQKPIGGKDVWDFAAADEVKVGERLVISSVGADGVALVHPSSAQPAPR